MRSKPPDKLEAGRVRTGRMASPSSYGMTGAFELMGPCGTVLFIIGSDGDGWEHVSVSTEQRPPNWEEMCFIKDLFWQEEECVIQYHPPRSRYINNHPRCLHLWRPLQQAVPMPPLYMVGIKV